MPGLPDINAVLLDHLAAILRFRQLESTSVLANVVASDAPATFPTSHRSTPTPVNALASENVRYRLVTFDVSQAVISSLKNLVFLVLP